MVRVRGTVGAFVKPQPAIGGVIADNYAEASRLFNADQFYDCSRWLLGQHQRLPIHSEVVLVACAYDERALCHHDFRCQHVGGHCVRAVIEIKRIKDRDLVSVGCTRSLPAPEKSRYRKLAFGRKSYLLLTIHSEKTTAVAISIAHAAWEQPHRMSASPATVAGKMAAGRHSGTPHKNAASLGCGPHTKQSAGLLPKMKIERLEERA